MRIYYQNRETGLTVEADEGKSLDEAILQLVPFLQWPKQCPFCRQEAEKRGSPELEAVGRNIVLNARTPQGNLYVEYLCKDCGAHAQWGKYRDRPAMFVKEWQPKYQSQRS